LGISETRWFGHEVGLSWSVLANPDDEPVQRNEGWHSAVAAAWRNCGDCWRAYISNFMNAVLSIRASILLLHMHF